MQEAVVLPVRLNPLAALLVPRHVQTEDYEETLSEYILGQEYSRFFFKPICFGPPRARGTITGQLD